LADSPHQSARKPRRRSRAGATMADVAEAAGVSMQTVSRALRRPETVAPGTRALIEAAIGRIQYVPNLAASHLASDRSRMVAAVIPTLSASVFAETIEALSVRLEAAGYQIFLGHSGYDPDREAAVIRSLLGRRPDGIFVVGTSHSAEGAALLARSGVPVVEAWDLAPRPVDKVVGFSNRAAMGELLAHVVASGRRRPVFAAVMRPGDSRASARRDGYRDAARRLLPEMAPRLCLATDLPLSMASGAALLERLLVRFPDADAALFSSDLMAAGALLAAERRGIAVPGRLAVTGFGDFEFAAELNPPLTTIAVPAAEIGRRAGDLLVAAMEGEEPEEQRVDVGYRLVVRASTAG